MVELAIVLVLVGLSAAAYLSLRYSKSESGGYRLEVPPSTWGIVKDVWLGQDDVRALPTGSHQLRMGRDLVQGFVHTRDEAMDIPPLVAVTADQIQMIGDLVVKRFRVKNDAQSARKSWLNINFDDRKPLVGVKIAAGHQNVVGSRDRDAIFPVAPGKESVRQVNQDVLSTMEAELNQYLVDEVTEPWGIEVEVEFQNAKQPEKLERAAVDLEAAKMEGQASKSRATEAGVSPEAAFWADILVEAARAFGGNSKRGGSK